MTRLLTRMTTSLFGLATLLLAVSMCIFTFTWSVASLPTCVTTTFEGLATNKAAKHVCTPTRLVLQHLLSTQTRLLGKERALRAFFLIHMTVVCCLRMTASFLSATGKIAWRRSSTTRQRRLQRSTATIAADILKYGFLARTALTLMAQICAVVVTTFQWTAAWSSTNMLSLKLFSWRSSISKQKCFLVSLSCQSFRSESFTRTAALSTFVASAVQSDATGTHAPRHF